MPVKIITTKTAVNHANVLVYGESGIGKTVLQTTVPDPIIISAEKGLMSVSDHDIPVIEVHNLAEIGEAYEYLKSAIDKYQTVCLDSLSEIAEAVLAEQKSLYADGRQAYGKTNDLVAAMIKSFRDLPFNTYFIAKQGYVEDESGVSKYMPLMPGKTLTHHLPYYFDIVMCMRMMKDDEGNVIRYLQTQPDMKFEAKDRSGKLDKAERAHLGRLFDKVLKQGANNG